MLGGDDYHTVGSPRAVNGGGGGILQDVDTLDIGRVEAGQTVFAGEAVDDVKRFVALGDGDTSAHADGDGRAGFALGLRDVDTCHSSGQCRSHVRCGGLHQLVALDGYHGAGQILTGSGAVADDYDFVQQLVVRLQGDVNLLRSFDRYLLRAHTYKGEDQDGLACVVHFQGVFAVDVADGADAVLPFHGDVGANHLQTFVVCHFAFHGDFLGACR